MNKGISITKKKKYIQFKEYDTDTGKTLYTEKYTSAEELLRQLEIKINIYMNEEYASTYEAIFVKGFLR